MTSRNQARRGGNKRERPDEWATDARDAALLQNEAFAMYYKVNHIVPESEWDSFMNCLRTSLPMALRVNLITPNSEAIITQVESLLSSVFQVRRLSFFPHQMALQCDVSRGDLKRNVTYKSIKKLIAALNEGGYLTRQEAVSMIPVISLQVRPGDRVLDLCASPGSKTSQILEILLSQSQTGVVVANDVNASRLDVLQHQTNRLAGAHSHLIVTQYDAARFPSLSPEDRFDRVLCDVVCSGDGTLRKSVDMWPRWNSVKGADLHFIQTRILMRGMELCKKGGIVVYSTCSLNPVEDEAVVSECLRRAKGRFCLIDTEPLLPGLKSSPGLSTWSLTSKGMDANFHDFEEAKAYMDASQPRKGFQYKRSMFPNPEELREQNIHFSRRILPHTQDTGGFFVVAMVCIEEMETSIPPTTDEEPAVIRPISDSLRTSIQNAFRLPDSFPYDKLLCRNEVAREQKIYYANVPTIELSAKLGGRVVSVGSKIFEAYAKYSNDKLRFHAEGVSTLESLLPPNFVYQADPQLFVDVAQNTPMKSGAFRARLNLPPEEAMMPYFLLSTRVKLVGLLYAVVEFSTRVDQVIVRVADWQVTLCKQDLELPIVASSTANDADKDDF
ncbi:unnamed protein product [Phytomonas sp. Hart1]|nr:unnamed protein product [Phytomonas sp. Hart1]|eukprot:CCW67279.1 unnamed protein product [Phytomonas sp. isolate Hart1]